METPRTYTFDEISELRPKTNEVTRYLQTLLTQHVETLRPLLDPACILGKAGGSGRISWMDKSLGEYRTLYEKLSRPFRFPSEFDLDMVNDAGDRLEVHPWEYQYEARSGQEAKRITLTSPTRWVLSYGSDLPIARMKAMVAGREQSQLALQQRFVLLAILLNLVVQKCPHVALLMKALRFELGMAPCEELHGLPLVTVTFALPSFRPDDTLMLKATVLSGVPAFIELLDPEVVRQMKDPIKEELERIVS
jgi:hypothetical protein